MDLRSVIDHLIAENPQDFLAAFEHLTNPSERKRIGTNARASVIDAFSRERQAALITSILDSLADK